MQNLVDQSLAHEIGTATLPNLLEIYVTRSRAGVTSGAAQIMGVHGAPSRALRTVTNLTVLANTIQALLRKQDPTKETDFLDVRSTRLSSIPWSSIGRKGFAERYAAEYDLLCEVVMAEGLKGMWPVVCYDLLQRLDEPLLHPRVPGLIERHPSELQPLDLSRTEWDAVQQEFAAAAHQARVAALLPRIPPGLGKKLGELADQFIRWWTIGEIAKQIWDAVTPDQDSNDDYDDVIDHIRNAEPMAGAEDHVDSFDRNREWIERTC